MERLKHKSGIRGLLLTMITVVIVVLITGEVISLVYTNIQYDNLAIQSSPSSTAASLYNTMQSTLPSFLRTSLATSISALANYETTNGMIKVNDTQYALSTMVTNGLLYGVSMSGYIGNATVANYIHNLETMAIIEGLNMTVSNSLVQVYQTSPYSLNISYVAAVNITSNSGSILYPINISTNLSIQGLPDLYLSSIGSSGYSIYSNGSRAIVIGNTSAISVSRSPYLFAYGPLFIDNASNGQSSSCTDSIISSAVNSYQFSQYILVAPNSVNVNSIVCGFGGLITYHPNTTSPSPILKPYLVYNPISGFLGPVVNGNVIVTLPNGRFLMGGGFPYLTDITPIESAIANGYYLNTGYSPSYMQLSSGSTYSASPYGLAPLNLLNRQVASLNQNNNVIISNLLLNNTPSGGHNTVSFWMQWPNSVTGVIPFSFSSYYVVISGNMIGVSTGNGGDITGVTTGKDYQYLRGSWVHVVIAMVNGAPSTSTMQIYLNGVSQTLSTIGTPHSLTATSPVSIGGESAAGYSRFKGQMANLQIYNVTLNPYQVYALYSGGINSRPIRYDTLVGWWPLNGNANDYSTHGNDGVPTGSTPYFQRIFNYLLNTLGGGGSYQGSQTTRLPVSQCYNIDNCSYDAPGQVYINLPGNYSTSSIDSPQGYLGLPATGLIPGVANFDDEKNSSIVATSVPLATVGSNPVTVSFWMDLYPGVSASETPLFLNNYGLSTGNGCFGLATYQGSVLAVVGVNTLNMVANRWVNVVAEFGGANKLYLNGALQSTPCNNLQTFGSTTGPGSTVYIGAMHGTLAPFAGSIADVQVYNSLLPDSQVANLYLNNSLNSLKPTGYWPLSTGYNGYLNQTPDLVGPSIGYVTVGTSATVCTESNSIASIGFQCGVEFVPHNMPDNYPYQSSS